MNKQPFYHRATVLFTVARPLSEEEIMNALEIGLRNILSSEFDNYVDRSVEVEEFEEPEAGNPDDLM